MAMQIQIQAVKFRWKMNPPTASGSSWAVQTIDRHGQAAIQCNHSIRSRFCHDRVYADCRVFLLLCSGIIVRSCSVFGTIPWCLFGMIHCHAHPWSRKIHLHLLTICHLCPWIWWQARATPMSVPDANVKMRPPARPVCKDQSRAWWNEKRRNQKHRSICIYRQSLFLRLI